MRHDFLSVFTIVKIIFPLKFSIIDEFLKVSFRINELTLTLWT